MFKTLIASTAIALSLANFAHAEAPMAFDVAEDHTRIFMAAQPVHENGMPAHMAMPLSARATSIPKERWRTAPWAS